ncbi:unnamed protein product, partial [Brassica oleracea]
IQYAFCSVSPPVLTSGGPKIEHTGVRVSSGAKARRSQRQPPRTSVLDLKSANLGVTLLPLCLFRRLPEALSFEDMLGFVLLCTRSQEGCEECVLPLCRLESIYLSDVVAGYIITRNTILALIQCLAKRRRSNNNERNPRTDRPSHLMLLSLPLLGRPITVPTLHSRPTHRNIESPLLHLFLRTHRRSLRQLHHNHYLALLALHLLSSHPRPLHLRFTCNQSFRWKSLFREGKG